MILATLYLRNTDGTTVVTICRIGVLGLLVDSSNSTVCGMVSLTDGCWNRRRTTLYSHQRLGLVGVGCVYHLCERLKINTQQLM